MSDNEHQRYFLEARAAAGGDDIAAIRALRERFRLDLMAAKQVMLSASGVAASVEEHQERLIGDALAALDEFEARESSQTAGDTAVDVPRRLHFRLMQSSGMPDAGDAEMRELEKLLLAIVGVARVQAIEPHPKGGYGVTLDFAPADVAPLIAAIGHHGWVSVI